MLLFLQNVVISSNEIFAHFDRGIFEHSFDWIIHHHFNVLIDIYLFILDIYRLDIRNQRIRISQRKKFDEKVTN